MMKSKSVMFSLTCITFIFGLFPELTVGDKIPEYEVIEEISRDIATPQKRSAAIGELSAIVKDSMQNTMLRQFAAEKLGELGAIEAKDMLKNLAESLDWGDSTRQLKRVTTLAYWKIRVVEEPNEPAQEELLIKLLKGGPPPHADVVPSWAVDELASRGVQRALPDMIKRIRVNYSGRYADERIWLCRTKIQLLSTSASRQEALTKALATKDFTRYQRLKRWAIKELGKLGTQESRYTLIAYALELQSKYYDENGKWIGQKGDRLAVYAGEFYHSIIKILENSGMTVAEVKATGLRPDKFFISP